MQMKQTLFLSTSCVVHGS